MSNSVILIVVVALIVSLGFVYVESCLRYHSNKVLLNMIEALYERLAQESCERTALKRDLIDLRFKIESLQFRGVVRPKNGDESTNSVESKIRRV